MDLYNDFLVKGISAFTGAFFAFLFLRLGDFFSKLYSREIKHYNSLVILETQLNDTGGIIHDNGLNPPWMWNGFAPRDISPK